MKEPKRDFQIKTGKYKGITIADWDMTQEPIAVIRTKSKKPENKFRLN